MSFIGLTGGFGTGKTTVLKIFRKLGAYTINADKLVHEIMKKPAVIKKLSATLGKDILFKRAGKIFINKKRMADIIFNNPEKRKVVEKIIHPMVIKTAEIIKKKMLSKRPGAIIIFEVPLLFEAGYEKIFDKVIVVYCSTTNAIKRLEKLGFSREQALKRMHAQIPISKKKVLADFLINNNFDIDNTKKQVKEVFKELREI